MYPTLKGTVRAGKIEFLEKVTLPDNVVVLVTVLDDEATESLSPGEHLIAGLQDALSGRFTEISTASQLRKHLDTLFAGE